MKNSCVIISLLFLLACQKDTSVLETKFLLPKNLKEVSGMTYDTATKLLWVLEDSGNTNVLYALNSNTGTVEKSLPVLNTKNIDWEELTKDTAGNVYIGDFGNNDNVRQDLCIYKIAKSELNKSQAQPAYKISFSFPEQTDFPPKKSAMFYDTEAFFEYQGSFYLFTKNRSKNFDGTSLVYKIANKPGLQSARLIGKLKTCSNYNSCQITGATISPDATQVVLLCHDKVFVYEGFTGDNFLNGKRSQYDLNHFSQKESICFLDSNQILLADEHSKGLKAKVYATSLKKLKSKS
ncbi:hypothetical protein [Flavobacterium restrictum]|uniref:SdiA-regulated family protein n=1 Tax=Flavobacterium restrictum TaxID=2594428 RepID=A0A553E8Q0_9FLAO|nr:hypothetical protein [Flavobacterium restrictum]TRX41342.1 hypothetical protein FNW21_04395 [Flavobacterium restrictum]